MASSSRRLSDEDIDTLQTVAARVVPAVELVFGQNSCIPTTRVLVDALRQCGVPARPLVVTAEVVNAAYLSVSKRLRRPLRDAAEAQGYVKSDGLVAYSLGPVDGSPHAGHWSYHLVAVLRQRAIVDLTIGQANHAQYNMVLEPVFAHVTGRFLNGLEPAEIQNNGCKIYYQARIGDESYRETPNWNDPECQRISQGLLF